MIEQQQVSPLKKVGKAAWQVAVGADAFMYSLSAFIDSVGQNMAVFEAYESGLEGKLPTRVVSAMATYEVLGRGQNPVKEAFQDGATVRLTSQLSVEREKQQEQFAEQNAALKIKSDEQADGAVANSVIAVAGFGIAGAGVILDKVVDRADLGYTTRKIAKVLVWGLSKGGSSLALGATVEAIVSSAGYLKANVDGIENGMRSRKLAGLNLNDIARQQVTERMAIA